MIQYAKGWPGFLLTIALLVVGMSYLVSRTNTLKTPAANSAPETAPAVSHEELVGNKPFMERMRQLARQTKGDWTRLSFEDQQRLNGYTAGHGATMFSMLAKEQKPSPLSSSKTIK